MPTELFLVPLDENRVPDLQLQENETWAYASGTINRDINDTFYQADDSLPAGYDSILSATELFGNADPPVSTGWKVEALKNETVPRMYGGVVVIAPARAGLPLALVRVDSTQAKLDVLNTRLRAIVVVTTNNFYGRVPLTATGATRNTIADKFDELAADLLIPKPGVSAALAQAATATQAITLSGWKVQFYDVLATLFQLPSRQSIERTGIGKPQDGI